MDGENMNHDEVEEFIQKYPMIPIRCEDYHVYIVARIVRDRDYQWNPRTLRYEPDYYYSAPIETWELEEIEVS
jgi:hypothetical protein